MLTGKQKFVASALMKQSEMKRKKIHLSHILESQNYLKLGNFNHKLTVRADFRQRYLALLQNRERQQQKTLLLET